MRRGEGEAGSVQRINYDRESDECRDEPYLPNTRAASAHAAVAGRWRWDGRWWWSGGGRRDVTWQ